MHLRIYFLQQRAPRLRKNVPGPPLVSTKAVENQYRHDNSLNHSHHRSSLALLGVRTTAFTIVDIRLHGSGVLSFNTGTSLRTSPRQARWLPRIKGLQHDPVAPAESHLDMHMNWSSPAWFLVAEGYSMTFQLARMNFVRFGCVSEMRSRRHHM